MNDNEPEALDEPLAFVLGKLSYDFGTEARRDYFIQQFENQESKIFDPIEMARYLGVDHDSGQSLRMAQSNYQDANALIWTLSMDGNPIYALEPESQHAVIAYERLVEFLVAQELEGVELVSIAGYVDGTTRLFNGDVVPTIKPVVRGMFNWSGRDIVEALSGADGPDGGGTTPSAEFIEAIRNFLERVYYELRNLGRTPPERAINYAATNAYQAGEVYVDAIKQGLRLDAIGVERSPICRPSSSCWDVKMSFFDPANLHQRARRF